MGGYLAKRFLAPIAYLVSFSLVGCGGGSGGPIGTPIAAVTPAPGATSTPLAGVTSPPAAGSTASPSAGATTTPAATPTGAATASQNAADGIPFPAATDPDPFYAQPNPFPNVPHGTILASRSITYEPGGVTMTNTAYQVKFASRDLSGRKIAPVMTVVMPMTPATGVPPVVVEDFAEDALGAQCAPSHYVMGSTNDSNEVLETGLPTGALAAGDTLVIPDFEGPFSLYAVGPQEGYITLDAEIAALQFAPLGLSPKSPIGQNGYSGGAHAVSWAAALQPTYASQLNLVGTATGGTPADILGILENIDGTSALSVVANEAFFNIIYMSGVGINRGFPNFITPILNAKGVAAATAMENGCLGKNSDGSSGPTGHFVDYLTVTDPYTNPNITTNAAADSEPQPGIFPTSNIFEYHSVTDELIPVAGEDELYAGWCADGTPITYFRDPAGGDHVTMELDNVATVLTYFQERFAGTPLTVTSTQSCNQS